MNNYVMQRGWMHHPVLDYGEPYSHREAWLWLIENAVWSDKKVKVQGRIIVLKRGQLSYAVRFMAERWGWKRGSVERFLGKLKENAMIETIAETGQLIISICNYEKYQLTPKFSKTLSRTEIAFRARQQKDNGETNKNTFEIPDNTKANTAHGVPRHIGIKLINAGIKPHEVRNLFKDAEFNLADRCIIFTNQFARDHVQNHLDMKVERALGFNSQLAVRPK